MIVMADSFPVPIIRSKLYPPPLAVDTVLRERLVALAPSVASTLATLVSAPAGYGKSTLVRSWLNRIGGNTAWLSLDAEDSDLRQFGSYVVAALDSVLPDCCGETLRALHSPELPGPGGLAAMLSNDLDALDASVVLVLDDYYKVNNAAVHEFVDALLMRPPRQIHLIFVTRRDPPLALQAGDIILLCTDGVWSQLKNQELEDIVLDSSVQFEERISDLVDNAVKAAHPNSDNATVLALFWQANSNKSSNEPNTLQPGPGISNVKNVDNVDDALDNLLNLIDKYN